MDSKQKPKVSVILTTFNEGHHLKRILKDLSQQSYPLGQLEILLLEAGKWNEDLVVDQLGESKKILRYFHVKGLSRTSALNLLVKEAVGELIVRVDARTHVSETYIEKLVLLSEKTGAANVGGVKIPVGESEEQELIANVIAHPLSLGGGKFRNKNYKGIADSVYLGCFRKKLMPPEPWFDENNPKISEDSDLNFRIRRLNQNIYVDASIEVNHYSRESFLELLRLSFNYGVGRGLFVLKHKQFSAIRQSIPILMLFFLFTFLLTGYLYPVFHTILISFILIYILIIKRVSKDILKDTNPVKELYVSSCLIGLHLLWTMGLFFAIFDKLLDRSKLDRN